MFKDKAKLPGADTCTTILCNLKWLKPRNQLAIPGCNPYQHLRIRKGNWSERVLFLLVFFPPTSLATGSLAY